jgi:hypothetical protein
MANQVNIENILLIALEMSNKNTFKMELKLFSIKKVKTDGSFYYLFLNGFIVSEIQICDTKKTTLISKSERNFKTATNHAKKFLFFLLFVDFSFFFCHSI